MSQIHLLIPSFNSGELSPLMGARFGVEKVTSGCRLLRNFLLHVHGPAFRRPGLQWMGASASNAIKSRLARFNFSTTTGFVLEFHPEGLRVWSNGFLVPLVTEVELPYSESECAELQYVQVNDVCYLVHPAHAPRKLVRWADNDWRMTEIPWKWPALGDENVRSDEIATPTTDEILSVVTEEWPEFTLPVTFISDFSVTNPDLTAAHKVARLQHWSGTAWVNLHTFTWTTVAPIAFTGGSSPGGTFRMTYVGPAAAAGTIDTTWIEDTAQLTLDDPQPASLEAVTVPVGDWQALVTAPDPVPAGAKVVLQKKVGTAWRDVQTLIITAGQTTIYRGAKLASATDFRFDWRGPRSMAGAASIETITFPDVSALTLAVSVVSGPDRTLTASNSIFVPGHVGAYFQIAHRREDSFSELVAAVTTITAATSSAIRVSGKWELFSYGTWAATLYLEKKVGGIWETLRSWSSKKDRNVIASGEEDSEVELRLRISAGTSEAADTAAVPRFVLEATDAVVYGLVKVTAVGSLDANGKATTATCDVLTEVYATTATPLWTEGAFSDAKGYPRTVALHGGRLWFGGTRAEPQRLWGSLVNDYENFRRSSFDDASVSFTPAASESNQINWMLSHESEMIIGTSGEEWTIGTDSGPITPTNVLMQRRSGYGSRYLPGLLLNDAIVFVQRGGKKLRQITPRADITAWSAADLTVLAEHVAAAGVVQMAAMSNPYSILWAVTSDGKLLGMTFEQEQNVFGWHVHNTDGLIESVAVVNGADTDEVWVAVNRNGRRSVERFDPLVFSRDFSAPARLIYLDAAVRFEPASPTATVTGLGHLEGREVVILADGAVHASRIVAGGAVVLDAPASVVIVGLPFTSELQPMKIEVPLRDGTAQNRRMKPTRVGLSLHESLGGEIACSPSSRFEQLNFRTTDTPTDAPPPLFTGDVDTVVESRTDNAINVIVRQTAPLPLNVGALTVFFDVYGG